MARNSPISETVTLHVPFSVVKLSGRTEMQLSLGVAPPRLTDNAQVKAVAPAFRWQRMLDSGECSTIVDLAERQGIASSYPRILRLPLLAPDIIEAILDGRHGPAVTLARVLEPFPLVWTEQHNAVGTHSSRNGNQPVLSLRRSIG